MVAKVTFVTGRSNYLTTQSARRERVSRSRRSGFRITHIHRSNRALLRSAGHAQSRLPKRENSPIHFLSIFSLCRGSKRNPTSRPEYQRGDALNEK